MPSPARVIFKARAWERSRRSNAASSSGVKRAWLDLFDWEFVTATNAALCQPKQALHKPTCDAEANDLRKFSRSLTAEQLKKR